MPLAAARAMCKASSAAFWGSAMAEGSASAIASASSVVVRIGRPARNTPRSEAANGIAGCTLRDDDIRDEEFIFAAVRLLPVSSHLLISGNYQVTSQTRR